MILLCGNCLGVSATRHISLILSHHSVQLQHSSNDISVQAPVDSALLEGRWRLLFTTRPGSASPIQRTFTGVEAFTVYQEILLESALGARVNNIVDFGGKVGQLKVAISNVQ